MTAFTGNFTSSPKESVHVLSADELNYSASKMQYRWKFAGPAGQPRHLVWSETFIPDNPNDPGLSGVSQGALRTPKSYIGGDTQTGTFTVSAAASFPNVSGKIVVDPIPVSLDFITRDPETGLLQNLGGLVDKSDPRPGVEITSVEASLLPSGELQITVEGLARDYLSEFLESAAGETSSIELFLNGASVATITNLQSGSSGVPVLSPWQRRDSTKSFSHVLNVPGVSAGVYTLMAKTNANAVGQQGWASAGVLVQKIQHGDIQATGTPAVTLAVSQNLTTTTLDSVAVTINGNQSFTLSEEVDAEASGVFVGNATIDGQSRKVSLSLPPTFSVIGTTAEMVSGRFNSRASGFNYHNINWLESNGSKCLKSFSVSSSCIGVFSNG